MPDSPTLVLTVEGRRYQVALSDMNALDARDFRQKTGLPLVSVFRGDVTDLDLLSALLWLVRRKTERKLTYEQVASEFSYGTDFDVDKPDENDGQGEVDPTTSGDS